MAAVTEEFMSKLFAAQQVERKKENKEFKEEIQVMISEGIKCEVENATKPLKESQEKIIRDQAELLKTVEELSRKVKDIEKEKNKDIEYPRLQKDKESELRMRKNSVTERRADKDNTTNDQKAVMGLFKMSNVTLGLSPISKEFIEAEVAKQRKEIEQDEDTIKARVMMEAVKDFMIMEMKVKEEHFYKLDIVRIFSPQKSDWQTLYVQLESQEQVDWLLSHTRWIPESEPGQVQTKVVKYVPRQLYKRWNAIQAKAFSIRKESNRKIQTKVGHGKDDFYLQTRYKGEKIWNTAQLPADLPMVELEFLSREERSPVSAPGRDQYRNRIEKRKERPSNGSSSSGSPPPKHLNTQNRTANESVSGLLARPDIQKVVESGHPPGSPGEGINNPNLFSHLDSALVSSRKK